MASPAQTEPNGSRDDLEMLPLLADAKSRCELEHIDGAIMPSAEGLEASGSIVRDAESVTSSTLPETDDGEMAQTSLNPSEESLASDGERALDDSLVNCTVPVQILPEESVASDGDQVSHSRVNYPGQPEIIDDQKTDRTLEHSTELLVAQEPPASEELTTAGPVDGGAASDSLSRSLDGPKPPPEDPSVPAADGSSSPAPAPSDKGNFNVPGASRSQAREDWAYQRSQWGANAAMEELMDMVGLEAAKARFVEINTLVTTQARQRQQLPPEDEQKLAKVSIQFGAVFIGNPGTGKKRVAELYGRFLALLGKIPNKDKDEPEDIFARTTATRLASLGTKELQEVLDKIRDGGVLMIDDAHQMTQSGQSTPVLDLLVSELEPLADIVLVLAGHGKDMESLAGQSLGLLSLVPTTVRFPNYTDDELQQLLVRDLQRRFGTSMEVEDGPFGRFTVIAAKRVGRGRDRVGFGNRREIQMAVDRMLERQASRLFRQMRAGNMKPGSDLLLTRADVIGPPPTSVFDTSEAWAKLNSMVGLQSVKDTLAALVHQLQVDYEHELAGKLQKSRCSLNKLFLGNPGTGKTTVAKLYGKMLAEMGLLSTGEVVVKNPSDFIDNVLGGSERKTRAILDATKGKVLIIDEAYMLGGSDDRFIGSTDSYRTAVVDTIVGEVQSTGVEDRCVLLLGYKDRMENMLNAVNPALARRFPLASAFVFEDYTDDELERILDRQLDRQGLRLARNARMAARDVLKRARQRVGFGNAGEVDILLDRAKLAQHLRLSKPTDAASKRKDTGLLIATDIDEAWDRGMKTEGSIDEHFKDFVGCEALIQRLKRCQAVVRRIKAQEKNAARAGKKKLSTRGSVKKDAKATQAEKDPRDLIPFTFLFCGPPGTGKTTAAKRMGKVFYEMGFLSTPEVMDRSASHLVGEYVGHTGPKTQKLFEAALGRVLFIDEAYRLSEGSYAREAVVEMVNLLDSDKYRKKMVVILAGYRRDIQQLMTTNPGFTSRFPEVIDFDPLTPSQCTALLFKRLEALQLDGTDQLKKSVQLEHFLKVYFGKLSQLPFWGNGRDVATLAAAIQFRVVELESPHATADKRRMDDDAENQEDDGKSGNEHVESKGETEESSGETDEGDGEANNHDEQHEGSSQEEETPWRPPTVVVEDIIIDEVMSLNAERQARSAHMRPAQLSSAASSQPRRQQPAEQSREAKVPPPSQPPPQTRTKVDVKKDTKKAAVQENPELLPEAKKLAPPVKLSNAVRGPLEEGGDDDDDGNDEEDSDEEDSLDVPRDPGVSDQDWEQLQRDKLAAKQRRADIWNLGKGIRKLETDAANYQAKIAQAANNVQAEGWRQSLRELQDAIAARKANLAAREEAARQEKAQTDALEELGPCPMGYKWIRQDDSGSYYRCAGGSHYGTFDELMKGKYETYQETTDDYDYYGYY